MEEGRRRNRSGSITRHILTVPVPEEAWSCRAQCTDFGTDTVMKDKEQRSAYGEPWGLLSKNGRDDH